MSFMDKLLGLATVGSAVANTTLFYRFVSGLTGVLALTMVAALMGGAMLIGTFYAGYLALVFYGLAPPAALVSVALVIVVTMGVILFMLTNRIRRLKELSRYEVHRDLPGLSPIIKVVEAFMEGLLSPRKGPKD